MAEGSAPPPNNQRDKDDIFTRLKSKIDPNLQQPIALVFGLAIVLIAYRLLFGKVTISPGHLPGDFYYSSDTTYVFFPFTTCIVASIIINVLMRLMNANQ